MAVNILFFNFLCHSVQGRRRRGSAKRANPPERAKGTKLLDKLEGGGEKTGEGGELIVHWIETTVEVSKWKGGKGSLHSSLVL